MNVSNSTGENTGYRVLGSGTTPKPPRGRPMAQAVMHSGTLEPNTYVTLAMPADIPCTVQFLRGDKVIAQHEVKHPEILIVLIQNGRGAPKPHLCRRK